MINYNSFESQIPQLDFSDGPEMLKDFSQESQRHLISARNSLLVLETVPSDMEAVENIFKTFHTVSGLADFLGLNDIYWVTKKAEELVNLVRKRVCTFEGDISRLTKTSLRRLQELFELLDEQIDARGSLGRDYPDQTPLVHQLQQVLGSSRDKGSVMDGRDGPVYQNKELPELSLDFEEEEVFYDRLKQKIQTKEGNIVIRKEPLERLLTDFKKLGYELKLAQGKVQERQKELIKERELAMKLTHKAQEDARSKSDYLANMSHEIRTLINAILGFTELIKDDLPKDSRQVDHLNTIIVSGKMLLEIVNNILDFSKVEAGKLKLEEIPFNLRDVAEDVFQIVRARLDKKPINLYLDIHEYVPLALAGDPTRLKQILVNLLDNAIKFTEKGEIGLSVRLSRQQGQLDRPTIHFTLKDTGIGIPEDRKNLIFESFTQADVSTTRLYGGTGLGLSLCRAFVEAMNGNIWVNSALGVGTEFNFVIQFSKAPEGAEMDQQIVLPNLSEKKVVLITPFDLTVKMFRRMFDRLPIIPLSICQNLKHAREVLTSLNRPPDIIFLDGLFPANESDSFAKDVKEHDIFQKSSLVAISSDIKFFDHSDERGDLYDGLLLTPVIQDEFISVLNTVTIDRFGTSGRDAGAADLRKDEPGIFSGIRILVVEDSIPNQELLRVHFEDLGCACDYASNGKEALEYLKRARYDLCFMDLQMPLMGGLDATQKIRGELNLKIPIIALTAAEVQEERQKCLDAGMDDYLAKPFDVEQLKEKIRNFKI